jgi:hypothetical protein
MNYMPEEIYVTADFCDEKHIARESFGIRPTEFVHHGPLKRHGKRLLLRGAHRHEDHAARCLTG